MNHYQILMQNLQMRAELIKLHAHLQATSIYVTHDQIEAMTMGDKIVVMNNKRIQQIGSPMDIYHNPLKEFRCRLYRKSSDELP